MMREQHLSVVPQSGMVSTDQREGASSLLWPLPKWGIFLNIFAGEGDGVWGFCTGFRESFLATLGINR